MKSSSARLLYASGALAVAVLAVACSSSNSSPPAPLDTGDDSGSNTSNSANTSNPGGNASTDSGATDSAASSSSDDASDSGPLVCPSISGSFLSTSGGGDSSTECPAAQTDTCVFSTNTTTCQLTAVCEMSADSFMGPIDSTGRVTYTRSLQGITGTCFVQFSSDHTSFTGGCSAFGLMCDASGELTD